MIFSVLRLACWMWMPLCMCVRLWRDLVVRPTHVVQKTSTTPRPVLPTRNPDGPRAEALIKPETLRAWLRRIEYQVLMFFFFCFFYYIFGDTHIIFSVKEYVTTLLIYTFDLPLLAISFDRHVVRFVSFCRNLCFRHDTFMFYLLFDVYVDTQCCVANSNQNSRLL